MEFSQQMYNVETACNKLYEIILDVIKKFVPKKLRLRPTFPHWFSHELKQLLLIKQLVQRAFKQSFSISNYKKMFDIRLKYKKLFKKWYSTYLIRTQNYLSSKPNAHFENLLKNLRKIMIYPL